MSESYRVLELAVLESGLPDICAIVVGVSGGPDSVALLHVLRALAERDGRDWRLLAVHVNHGLRGEEALRDEQFVRELTHAWDIPLEVVRVDTAAHAAQSGLSIEAAGRELRYHALTSAAAATTGAFIATGHTADDQAETVLLNLVRGAGLRGLAGMPPRRGAIVRPFGAVRHETIARALEEIGQEYALDSSNLAERYRRNFVRRRLIPTIQEVQPQIVPVLVRTAADLRIDADFLEREAARAVGRMVIERAPEAITVDRAAYLSLHLALRRGAVREILERLLGTLSDIEEAHVTAIEQAIANGQSLSDRLPRRIAVDTRGTAFTLRHGCPLPAPPLEPVVMTVPGWAVTGVGTLGAEVERVNDREALNRLVTVCGPYHAVCDADRLGTSLTIRSRTPGDRINPLGSPGSKKIQDVFVDRHVPRAERDRVPIVTAGTDVVWIPGMMLSRDVAISPETERVVHLQWTPNLPDYRDTMRHRA